jgi:plasmid stabilization system protein ParE
VFHKLDEIDAERVMSDSLAAFRAIGVEPLGFRAPGGRRGQNTLALLRKYGIGFDSSVDEQAVATRPVMLDHGIANVPWLWQLIDYYQYHMHPDGPRTAAQYEELLYATLERVVDERGMMTPIFHAFVSGMDGEKFGVLSRFLRRAAADRRVTILTASQAAGTLAKPQVAHLAGERVPPAANDPKWV